MTKFGVSFLKRVNGKKKRSIAGNFNFKFFNNKIIFINQKMSKKI